jgi:hypothetical protein
MQHGCMERLNRKRGPQVWQFRWSEIDPGGKRLYHKKICLRLTTSNHWGGCEIHARTMAGVFA